MGNVLNMKGEPMVTEEKTYNTAMVKGMSDSELLAHLHTLAREIRERCRGRSMQACIGFVAPDGAKWSAQAVLRQARSDINVSCDYLGLPRNR